MGKKLGEQTDLNSRLQRAKTARVADNEYPPNSHPKNLQNQIRRVKDVEIAIPIVYGTVSFWLGKKADEYHSHKWTVYIRGATNEDLGVAIKRVVFQLHPSFNNPTRIIEAAPFELSETGWGEFEISMTIYFHSDVAEKQIELFHHLKLYPEDESGPQSTKKPVVIESYDEIVIAQPTESFYLRAGNHPAIVVSGASTGLSLPPPSGIANDNFSEKKRGDTKEHALGQWFLRHSEADELAQLTAARQQIQHHIMKLRRQVTSIEAEAQRMKSNSGQ
ncbi:transcription initiation factor TFIID subunit 14b isoform X1 [Cryptomeria japonica]|uniref:transcription initiation factor TFIID subunit 14b isoform X1 n=1 Tax=Cryptomeria japonica TaxID=3369 RepID=UPI0025ACEF73|nr:transcription initiation factor TFIID subunit 14b isoform X1 [Cryptomeria japonica]